VFAQMIACRPRMIRIHALLNFCSPCVNLADHSAWFVSRLRWLIVTA
jgi:hypothetical protein